MGNQTKNSNIGVIINQDGTFHIKDPENHKKFVDLLFEIAGTRYSKNTSNKKKDKKLAL
ncbi:MAG: hypothetical protein WBA74_10735 [Cyclobacteriaceae bacterium]